MSKPQHIAILGGGVAGLAVGYYAKKNDLPFTIYEASNRVGGNCITLKYEDFLFDSGAHRFHDKDTKATKEVKKLLGEDVKEINVPSQIYYNGKFIDFPLSPLNLLKNLGPFIFAQTITEVLHSRLKTKEKNNNFESFALHTYGNTLAKLFLLNFSEKLWGAPCDRLSPVIAGKRLKGLNLKTFLMETIFGNKVKTTHLEGSFYYPKMGIGSIAEKLADFCGEENILINSKVTKILHNHSRIQAVEINGKTRIDTDEVVSTLPLTLLLQMMEPIPPEEILLLAKTLRYRDVILVAHFLNRESVTEASTVYFPNSDFPFTRIYEPKNRSLYMSPSGQTSLVAEIPCQRDDKYWSLEDEELIRLVRLRLFQIGWIKEEEIIGALVIRINYGYPILEIGYEEILQKLNAFLQDCGNLKLSGRNGKFIYSWIHDLMTLGEKSIEDYVFDHDKS